MSSDSPNSSLQRLARLFQHYAAQALNRYRRLGLFGKMVLFTWALINVFLITFIIVLTPARIFQFLYDEATKLSHTRFGFLALGAIIFLVSFPPLIGHTTTVTVCGFAYGWRIGFFIAAVASIVGSATSFSILRLLFSSRLRQWSAKNAKFMALETVVKEKGLPLIILIRVSPFPPWVYSNSLFASIQSVALWQFVIATTFVFPKLLLHAFIGSRMAALSDGNQREEMDTSTKIMNGCFVGGGIVIAVLASWLVYTLVQNHIRKLEGVSPAVDELAAEAIEDFDEEAPLLRGSQEP
ncbi:Golgi apparatus membrane protein TVP38 [Lentinula aciculospora]|uniref:Golgi apparatus membrane protein TVP38 n=1 Tax=Lentinula aciculospora TaxID=153920 RepID=A0A9W8ZTF5_9AGAR|nr:Golgi apparatus membrane protein TVP38 [Lentinula aciculospora]